MATKNIVPRGNNEGQLGTDSKKWNKHIATTGSFDYISGSLRSEDVLNSLPSNLVSSSAQLSTQISGSFTSVSSSLASRIETREAFTTQSFSDGTATRISGSITSTGSFGRIETAGASDIGGLLNVGGVLSIPGFSNVSSSLAVAVAGGDNLGNHSATTTLNLDSNPITNVTTLTATGNISSSLLSTGSFGHIIKGGVNWDTAVSKSAASAGFGVGGGSSFTAAGISGSWQSYTLISGSGQIATQISGAFTSTSSSLASRITTAESELGNTLISGSGQIATAISGAFGTTSSSLASRITTNEGYLNQSVKTTDDVTFASLTATGDITARNYIVSSSITYMTQSFSSGSTIFGDDSGDTHQFTGSLLVTGSLNVESGDLYVAGGLIDLKNDGTQSVLRLYCENNNAHYAEFKAPAHSAFSGNVTLTLPATAGTLALTQVGLISGSAQIASAISGSLGTNASVIRGLTSVSISGSFTGVSSSLASRITTEESNVDSLQTDSGSFSTRLTTAETELGNTLISSSAQIASNISGSFTGVSSSLASRITTREAFITQSFSDGTATTISGSASSTGSFGHILKGGVNWDTAVSSSAATAGFGTGGGGGGSSFTSAGISGSFTQPSGSFSTRVSDLENPESVTADFGGYTFSTSSAQTTWNITHNLNSQYPNVTVYDSSDEVIIPNSITANTISSSTIVFTSPVSGKAHYSVGGNLSGSADSTGSFGLILGDGSQLTNLPASYTSAQISGSWQGQNFSTTQSFSDGTATLISGSIASTGSFGHILKGGVNWDTAVSTSAAAGGFSGGGGSSFTSAGISGSWQSYSLISGSGQIATAISGAFTSTSGSFSTRVSDLENVESVTADFGGYTFSTSSAQTTWSITHNLNSQYPNVTVYDSNDEVIIPLSITANTISSSTIVFDSPVSGKAHYSVGGNMSGSADSTGSFGLILGDGSQLTNLPASYTSAGISGSFTTVSSSLASRIETREAFITQSFSDGTATLISGSASSTGSFGLILQDGSALVSGHTSAQISGSFTGVSSSLASRIETAESELGNTLISGSAQIKTQISGAFTSTSSSLASRITTREAFITQSFSDGTATLISGSASSTGSFGHILKGGVNWDTAVSSSAATAGFGTGGGGGGSSFTSAGISGSFTSTSGSFSTRVTDLENPESVTADFGGYTFSTSSAQTTWNITHNLNSQYPNVTVYDSSDEVIIPNSITANTISSSTIVFTSPVSGKAHYSVGGNMSGSADSTGSFGHIQVVGDFLPTADNSSDLGSSTKRFANIHSADIQLSNEGTEGNEVDGTTGNWTIQEGEDDLYLLNRKNGKKYRFKLDEIK